ncbi:MAG: OadG family protein [Butyrivibrio sp.]|uniref:OadG family transporter subunit n=1 Tax=Butyrivibrio sp. TaxID=28121 RepID=UPI001B092D7E|nr:OadG family transporter subunit [Butyrivibrio sp.]MBO6240785.1 OadG family protein [Butyrivibrio sp.]
MKSKFLVLGVVLSCFLSLTACGETTATKTIDSSKYPAEMFNESSIASYMNNLEDQNFESWYAQGITPDNFEENLYVALAMKFRTETSNGMEVRVLDGVDEDFYNAVKSGYTSWYKALDDIGYTSDATLADDLYISDVNYYINDDEQLVIDATLQGTKHSALFQVYMNNETMATDMGVTVNKSNAEKLENAGLNTLLGMGMAFAVLIIISLIISLFPMFIGGNKKKKTNDKEAAKEAMDNTISQIAEKEDLASDAELVAVIAAAIAAYEGSASTDGFQVRSIRKVNKNWKR